MSHSELRYIGSRLSGLARRRRASSSRRVPHDHETPELACTARGRGRAPELEDDDEVEELDGFQFPEWEED